MSDLVVETECLGKCYRLYNNPRHRILDMLGLLRKNSKAYTNHWALQNVNVEVMRGEKVAIIGRNGAGKSTFLKLITGVIEPTEGKVSVSASVRALLQIGSGFHPDFTGRENATAYFQQLGINLSQIDELVKNVLAFSELGEYMDQPMKTYSSGMMSRLAFSVSTVIEPDLLVLDEVLGVGDGYFLKKSFDRIQELCSGHQTTLLLVTHDVYSALALCDRIIWIEHGSIMLDGDARTVADRYESSLRDDYERQLRSQRLSALEKNRTITSSTGDVRPVFGQIRCKGNHPIDAAMPIYRIALYYHDVVVAELFPGNDANSKNAELLLESGEGNWTDAYEENGKPVRDFSPFGSIFHRVSFVLHGIEAHEALVGRCGEVEIEYFDRPTTSCIVEFTSKGIGGTRVTATIENQGSGAWRSERIQLATDNYLDADASKFNRYGTQAFRITNVLFLNENNDECYLFKTGQPLKVRLSYRIEDPEFNESPTLMLAFFRDGKQRTNRFSLDQAHFSASNTREGYVELRVSQLLLAPGDYFMNVVVMREGAYNHLERNISFTVNDKILDLHSQAYEIKVVGEPSNPETDNVIFFHPSTWAKNGEEI